MTKRCQKSATKESLAEKRAVAVELRKEKWSITQIARRVRKSRHFVYAAMERKAATHSNKDRPRSGRPKVITTRIVKAVTNLVRKPSVVSQRKVRTVLAQRGTRLSLGTINRIIRGSEFRAVKPQIKPVLSEEHKSARLAFAQSHLNDSVAAVRRIAYLDEKFFVMNRAKQWVYIRKD